MGWSLFHETTCGRYNKPLKVNQACLNVFSEFQTPIKFYIRNTECYQCNFSVEGIPVAPMSNTSYVMDTRYSYESYFHDGKGKFCEMTNRFEDFGLYSMNISQSNCSRIEVLKEPEKIWVNIGLSISFYLITYAVFCLLKYLYRHCRPYLSSSSISLQELQMDLGNPNHMEERKIRMRRQSRISSIDAFRGIAIVLMIFVNYGGGDYTIFKHTPWNGLSIADLIFPWFVWLMGASVVLSIRSNLRTATSKKKIFFRIIKRTALLIIFGLILNSGKRDNGFIRICGVLQRLGVTYFFVASFELLIAKPQRNDEPRPRRWYRCMSMESFVQLIVVIALAFIHSLFTFLLPVPGCPTGYLGPGGLANYSSDWNCTGGAAGYIDRLILTENHMYHHGTFVKIYKPPVAFDPEGILGILTSIICAFFGAAAARIFLNYEDPYIRIKKWSSLALLIGIEAGVMCNWSQYKGMIPVNKNLWSISYVFATSFTACVIFTLLYLAIDFIHCWNGAPFIYPGMNAITLYLGHSLLKEQLPWRWVPYSNTHLEILIMDITATTIWTVISYILYKYNVFITL